MGQVAIVTGGSSGIGAAAAEYLAAHGCTVYEFSRHEKSGGSASVHHVTADVTDEASVAAAVQSVLDAEGRIDILLNNAGFGISGAAEFTSVEEAKRQLEVNFWGMVRVTRTVLPVMRAQRSGRIVNTSSVAAVTPIPFQTYYSASKAGVIGLTKTVAKEFASRNIQANAVAPGYIVTDMTGKLSAEATEAFLKVIPMQRGGKPEDVANVVYFLCSPDSDYVTGQVVNVDGGMLM